MNNLENKEILSDEIFESLKYIIENCPDVIIGGSIALNGLGLINRKVGDIDIFFPETTTVTNIGILKISDEGKFGSEDVTDHNGKPIQRTSTKIKNTKCCCFKVDDKQLGYSVVNVRGINIKLQNPKSMIEAKYIYADKNNKHKFDLDEINKNLNNRWLNMSNNLKWEEFTPNKVRTFQLGDEPEIIYLIKIRNNEFMIVHEDGYDLKTGKVEFHNNDSLFDNYKIKW